MTSCFIFLVIFYVWHSNGANIDSFKVNRKQKVPKDVPLGVLQTGFIIFLKFFRF